MTAQNAPLSFITGKEEGTVARIWPLKDLLQVCTRAQVRTRVENGELLQVAWGIYSDAEPDNELRLRALATIRGLVYTGATAMEIYEGSGVQWPVHARHGTGSRRTAEATVVAGVPELLRYRRGLPLVTPIQAVVDSDRSSAELGEFLAGMYSGIGATEKLERELAALYSGRERARELVAGAGVGVASRLEKLAFHIVRGALADQPGTLLTNVKVGNYCYDLVIPEARVAFEIDSYTYHVPGGSGSRRSNFIKDTWKRNDLTHLGWVLRTYTRDCVEAAPHLITEDIRAVVLPRVSRRKAIVPEPKGQGIWTRHPAL